MLCGTALRNKGVQPMLDAVVDYLPRRSTCRRAGHRSRRRAKSRAAPTDDEPFAALAFKIVDRPVRRQAGLSPRVLGHVDSRLPTSTTRPRTSASASAACCRCTPTTARTSRGLGRRHRRDRRPEGHLHRRYALRPERIRSCWSRSSSRSRSSRWRSSRRRKADQDKMGDGARSGWRKRTRRSECARTRTRARRLSPAWASCTWK